MVCDTGLPLSMSNLSGPGHIGGLGPHLSPGGFCERVSHLYLSSRVILFILDNGLLPPDKTLPCILFTSYGKYLSNSLGHREVGPTL